jgi:hypothetical protein
MFLLLWTCASDGQSLVDFYIHFQPPGLGAQHPSSRPTLFPPLVRLSDPTLSREAVPVNTLVSLTATGGLTSALSIHFFGPHGNPCKEEPSVLPNPVFAGDKLTETSRWRDSPIEGCGENYFIGPGPVRWTLVDDVVFSAPQRRRAIDGGEYEASAMVISRSGTPWATYFWGRNLGLVAGRRDWQPQHLLSYPLLAGWPSGPLVERDFELTTLPPPLVEGEVIEFVNQSDGIASTSDRYAYATDFTERTALDFDETRTWRRTGRGFKTGGYVSVCHFTLALTPNSRSQFFTANADECSSLRAAAQSNASMIGPTLAYRGVAFSASFAASSLDSGSPAICPVASIPLYRLYNAATAKNSAPVAPNHRFTTSIDVVRAMTARGWVDEGRAMCVPR